MRMLLVRPEGGDGVRLPFMRFVAHSSAFGANPGNPPDSQPLVASAGLTREPFLRDGPGFPGSSLRVDLWQGSLPAFVRAAEQGSLAGDMTGKFVKCHGALPSAGEVRSWEHSLRALARALRSARAPDAGVGVASSAGRSLAADRPDGRVGVTTEYHLPMSGRRIDVLLCGTDAERRDRAIVLELKQWSSVDLEDEAAQNVRVDGVEHAHPCQQAQDYAGWLGNYHSTFVEGRVTAMPMAFCHNLAPEAAVPLKDPRFQGLLAESPLFVAGEEARMAHHVSGWVGQGDGLAVLERIAGGRFHPSKGVLETLESVLLRDERWHLIDTQRVAHGAVLAEVRRRAGKRGHSVLLVRGGPGTGKSVIAVQLLADALRLGLKAAHSTGGRAFTTALRSKFRGADRLFVWNMNLRNEPTQALDLLLVDEAHRLRKTSDILYTPKAQRTGRPQIQELIDAARVTVFFLDEHQFVRPDEIGTTALVREAVRERGLPLREYDLAAQFRCGGCEDYVAWVDHLLGFRTDRPPPWRDRYRLTLVSRPEDLQAMVAQAADAGERARIVAGFCWKWSDASPDGSLVPDVQVGSWAMPWNRKRDPKKRYTPSTDPYTRWAETDEGLAQVGVVYSAQGFEFDRVGVIWGPDLRWRGGTWEASPASSHDRPVRAAGPEMLRLVRNAYRVLLTRGTRETAILCVDEETRAHVAEVLGATA